MKKEKKDLIIILGIALIFLGTLLPSIKIANENISFLKENGPITLILSIIMFILYKLEKKHFILIPSIISLINTIKFVFDNQERLKQITIDYSCFASFKYGIQVIIVGNILIILTLLISLININIIKKIIKNTKNKINIKEKKETTTKLIKSTINNSKQKIKNIKEKQNSTITKETSKDGEIKYNKIVVKCDNEETIKKNKKFNIKYKLKDLLLKFKLRKIGKNKLSISKFKNDYKQDENKPLTKQLVYEVPVIDIKKWTRNKICCINCGATVSTNSDYCFLCDCKMRFKDKEEIKD